MSSYDDWESAADSFDTLVLPNIPSLPPPKANWDDDEEDASITVPLPPVTKSSMTAHKMPPPKAPTKAAQERKAQEDADLRIAAEMLGGDGSVLAPAELPTGTLVDVAAFTKYGDTMCEHLHGLGGKVPSKHLMAFYRVVIADAAKHLAPEDLLVLGQAVDGARNEKLRALKAKAKPTKATAGVKVRVGREDEVVDYGNDDVGF